MTKFYNIYLCLLSYILLNFNSHGQNYIQTSSPCPNIYQYQANWFGIIKVPTPQLGETLLLEVEFIMFGIFISRDYGSLNLSRSQQETLQLIFNKAPYIHYIIRFPKVYSNYGDVPPQIIRIYYNKNVICSGTTELATGVAQSTVKLQNLLFSRTTTSTRTQFNNVNNNIINNRPQVYFPSLDDDYNEGYNFPVNQPIPTYSTPDKSTFQYVNQGPGYVQPPQRQPQPQPQPRPPQPQPQPPQPTVNQQIPFEDLPVNDVPQRVVPQVTPAPIRPSNNVPDEDSCGKVNPQFLTTTLVYGGDYIIHGQWPWLAAIYMSNGHSLNYKCGGNLVSKRVVVSAAHCFIYGGKTVSHTSINVYLGRHNLAIWGEDGQQERQVSLLKVHDDYMKTKPGSFDADIAVVVLKRVVEYNEYVQPICLWSGNTDLSEIHNALGTVVGWGITELGDGETEPKIISIPVVSQETCLRTSPEPFIRITSDRTFCAGYRNKTGPCNGDSGSGLAIQQNSRWALRGIVSVSAATDTINRRCDLEKFVVFTDAARFTDFIKQYFN